MSRREGDSPTPAGDISMRFPECDRLHRALLDCHRRIPAGPPRQSACRHLNRSLAECLVAVACPDESEAVRSLCSSGGTALKRQQCQQAQLSLAMVVPTVDTIYFSFACGAIPAESLEWNLSTFSLELEEEFCASVGP